MDRTCETCGETLGGGPRRRYCSDECRFAARRAREAEKSASEDNHDPAIPGIEPGRCRAGLEAWIEDNIALDLPTSLIEAARSLADQVDSTPRHSPLWARFLDTLRQLEEARREWAADAANTPFLQDLQMEMASLSAVEEYRAKRCAEADSEAERRRWGRLVPIGCARGEHRAHRWPAGRVSCIDCEVDLAEHVTPSTS